jgi:Ser-tRNA(Ala) deacylase AlaX
MTAREPGAAPAGDVWITGVQIAADYSRIDFKLEGFSAAMCAELERKVDAVLDGDHAVTSYYLPEAEFRMREDLLRTLEANRPFPRGAYGSWKYRGLMRRRATARM